jgi:hypothetical protein
MYGREESVQGLVHSETSTFYFRIVFCSPRIFVLVAGGACPLSIRVSVALTAPFTWIKAARERGMQ